MSEPPYDLPDGFWFRMFLMNAAGLAVIIILIRLLIRHGGWFA